MKKDTLAQAKELGECIQQLGEAINHMGTKASDLYAYYYLDDVNKLQIPPKPVGYLEHEESKTRIPLFRRIGWFHRCMLRWCFGLKYTKEG